MNDPIFQKLKARGSRSNRSGRFEPVSRERLDFGWGWDDDADMPVRVQVRH